MNLAFSDEPITSETRLAWAGRVRPTFTKHRYRRSKGKFSGTSCICFHPEPVTS